MSCAEKIKKAIIDKGISFYRIEKDLGFGNGYFGKIYGNNIKYDRIKKIADYLDIPVEYFIENETSEQDEVIEQLQILRDDVRGLLDVQRDMTPEQVKSMMEFAKFLKSQGGRDAD